MGPNRRALDREEAAARKAKAERQRATDKAIREDTEAVIAAWNERIKAGYPMLFAPSIKAALAAEYFWLGIHCPGCHTVTEIDLRAVDRHPDAAVTTLILSLCCRLCGRPGSLPVLTGLYKSKTQPTRKSGQWRTDRYADQRACSLLRGLQFDTLSPPDALTVAAQESTPSNPGTVLPWHGRSGRDAVSAFASTSAIPCQAPSDSNIPRRLRMGQMRI
jgi:hypothetical protein